MTPAIGAAAGRSCSRRRPPPPRENGDASHAVDAVATNGCGPSPPPGRRLARGFSSARGRGEDAAAARRGCAGSTQPTLAHLAKSARFRVGGGTRQPPVAVYASDASAAAPAAAAAAAAAWRNRVSASHRCDRCPRCAQPPPGPPTPDRPRRRRLPPPSPPPPPSPRTAAAPVTVADV